MAWLEKFGIGRSKKELKDAGLSERDIAMTEVPASDSEIKSVENIEIDPLAEEESKGVYAFPIPVAENFTELGQKIAEQDPPEQVIEQVGPFIVSRSPESHQNEHLQALDFLVPDGTPVLAVADGEIVNFQLQHTDADWGPSREFGDKANYITIEHHNGEFSQYIHLAHDSLPADLKMKLKAHGDLIVKRGQQIAVTGKTGWTDRDHLHFSILRELTPEEIESLRTDEPISMKSLRPKFEESEEEPKT